MNVRRAVGLASLFVFGLTGVSMGNPPGTHAIVSKSNSVIHFDALNEFVPCANNGAGEDVVFEGDIHVLITSTVDSGGAARFRVHSQPQGLAGVGQYTGDKYQASGVTQETEVFGQSGAEATFVNNFHLIGQGPGNNFTVHQLTHVTVNASGEITASTDHFTTSCK